MDTGKLDSDATYRLAPNVKNSLVIFVLYLIVVAGTQKMFGVPYTDITQSSDNLLKAVIIPVFLASAFLTAVAVWSGWWKDVFRDKFKIQGHNWMYLLVVFAALGSILTIATGDIASLDTKFILYAAIGTALVGYSEELMTRGLLLRGARGSGFSELKVFLFTSFMFGLMHSLNIINGQDVRTTLGQVVFAAVGGATYYAIFRKTGFLWVTMALHALFDFALLTSGSEEVNATSSSDVSAAVGVGSLFVYGSYILLLFSIRYFNVRTEKETPNK
jgi:membrane protease YdiL (CAAX protease family)